MIHDQQAAQAKIDALLDLPATLAGASALSLAAALDELGRFHPQEAEFGNLLDAAQLALDTVCSALLALRDNALEREKVQP